MQAQKLASIEVHSGKKKTLIGALKAFDPRPGHKMIFLSHNCHGMANPTKILAIETSLISILLLSSFSKKQ
jgi:hypothetical protein